MKTTLLDESEQKLAQLSYSVIVEMEKEGKYKATVWGLPDCEVTGDTREAALKSINQLLTARLENAEVVVQEIALPKSENPWIKFAGMYKDNPLFNEMISEMEAYRREVDAEMEEYYRKMDAEEQNK
ncbi:type II toxin-antitoxin system HicB family antitoxin [Aerosakkonema funiforme]|uniref:Type II toxin-antitoxin system HicB family antitoxin n=2 Tax=Oscillatoriophycideae TaxID=1301283 RepID=A0A926ZHZ6_9CYAN|nr:type II toxin-antitoxin system HicB family antitoxin [Aerosakkonema funiforme]MBD2183863.1 type II toxin-antitoxin system HicB family antitoxin [Aerosakkonema funiforme FACHB-1375]